MGKKIILAVFGGIAAVGLMVMLVGFAMGGRPGSMRFQGNQVVYQAGNEQVALGSTPWNRGARASDDEDWQGDGYTGDWGGWHQTDPETLKARFENAQDITLSGAANARKLDVEVSAGYLTLMEGDSLRVQVLGPLETQAEMDGDTLKVRSEFDTGRFHISPFSDGRPGFYRQNQDVTTEYLITLPKGLADVEAHLAAGVLTLVGLDAAEGEFSTDMGSMLASGCTLADAEFSTNLGAVEITGFSGTRCALNSDAGAIHFEGQVQDTLEVECSLGAVTAVLPRPQSYGWRTEVGVGSILIDGQQRGSMFSDQGDHMNTDQRPLLDLRCDVGSIEVTFA